MVENNSSSLAMEPNVPVTLTLSSIRKHYIFLPLFDAVKDLIAESMANEDAEETPALLNHEERYFETVPVAEEIDERREEEKEGLSEDEEDEGDHGDNEEDDDFFRVREYRLAGYRMQYKEFELLTERLPRAVNSFGVKYELINSELYLRTRPSAPHKRAAEAVKDAIFEWQRDPNNPGQPRNALDSEGGTSKAPGVSELLTNYDRLHLH
jgi:hypothetical protein